MVQEKVQMRKRRRKQGARMERQLALGLLQDAMSKVDKGRSYRETGYSKGASSDGACVVTPGVPGGPEIDEYDDAAHPYQFGNHYP
jgi:hypothetical protein